MKDSKRIGVGVLGLHEGRTLLVALTHSVPTEIGVSAWVPSDSDVATRAPHARAVAGCDLNPEKLAAAQADVPDAFFTSDYDSMLAREDVDVVAIYTPDAMHAEHIVRAFEAGKHVICTKPLTNSLEGAAHILEAGRRTGRKLLVGQSTRYFEPFRRQRSAVERGELGAIEFVDAQYTHRMDWYYEKSPWAATDTDWIFLGMSHPIDLLRWYLGPIRQVHAVGLTSALARSFGAGRDVVSLQASGEHAIGRALGHYGLHELPRARNAIELMLYGSEGTSLAQYHDMRLTRTDANGAEVVEDYLYKKRGQYFNNETHGMHYGEFANYAEAFARHLLFGDPYGPDLEEGVDVYCTMEAVRRSAETGLPVEVAPLRNEVGL